MSVCAFLPNTKSIYHILPIIPARTTGTLSIHTNITKHTIQSIMIHILTSGGRKEKINPKKIISIVILKPLTATRCVNPEREKFLDNSSFISSLAPMRIPHKNTASFFGYNENIFSRRVERNASIFCINFGGGI